MENNGSAALIKVSIEFSLTETLYLFRTVTSCQYYHKAGPILKTAAVLLHVSRGTDSSN